MSSVTTVEPLVRVRGTLRTPGDKSASHRSLILSALGEGSSTIHGLSMGHDVAATARIVAQLGARVEPDEEIVEVEGPSEGLRVSPTALDCENSGTTMRLMCGVLAAVPGSHRLFGDTSLSRRPMDRVAIPLNTMGAKILGEGPSVTAPLIVQGSPRLRGIEYEMPIVSAQVKSALLLAGLRGDSPTTVIEHFATRTTTEDMLLAAQVDVSVVRDGPERRITVFPGRPQRTTWFVPGDPSQAAFFVVLATIHPDASVEILDVDLHPERTGFLRVLERMGADVRVRDEGGRGRILATSSSLRSTEIFSTEIPSLDEVPALVVAACAAEGESVFRDVAELRVKESDRFAACLRLARALGATARDQGNDLYVTGQGASRRFSSFEIDAHLDHRIVMASAVAAAAGNGGTIGGAETVSSSYPHFFTDVELLGG